MPSVTLGGERLGSGNKNKLWLHNYERSSHDLSYVWRSTMAAGTLVPFMSQVALPGDTFDIDLNVDVLTHPTIGPLFGSYKVQLDVFQVPIRLYQAKLHMNMLGIGMDMSNVLLPQMTVKTPPRASGMPTDNQHISPSCILSYLGIRGTGYKQTLGVTQRKFNAVPYLAYWDIYKNYYANKQEEIGAVIHKEPNTGTISFNQCQILNGTPTPATVPLVSTGAGVACRVFDYSYMTIVLVNYTTDAFDASKVLLDVKIDPAATVWQTFKLTDLFSIVEIGPTPNNAFCYDPTPLALTVSTWNNARYDSSYVADISDTEPKIVTFPLENIDTMRTNILQFSGAGAFTIDETSLAPYGLPFTQTGGGDAVSEHSKIYGQEGLALKTYNSDLFNNWISTEWIDGADGISAITAIDTSEGSFTIDELNLSKKIYDMLNRIAVSGGTYDDWLDAVYTHDRNRNAENPMYVGGLIQSIVFQEVISSAQTSGKPLGTLAGRGKLSGKQKGGHIVVKIDEPSYLIGIASITPRVDYSQGNSWDMNLKTMNDFHKPALDAIGFQDLITDQMAWWDTQIDDTTGEPIFKSAGKQPAWVNYMTNVNVVRGNFADIKQQLYMTLTRRYEPTFDTGVKIADLTTYIDPSKFNHIFADTRRDAQNFWTQIGVNIGARRKMSAKVMPNL